MTSFIERIEAIYDARPLDKARVPEWETKDSGEVYVYYKPTTQHELDLVNTELPGETTGARWNVQLVILKALNAEGVRLFKNEHAARLGQKGFSAVTNRLAVLMTKVPSVEDRKNDSESTQ